MFHQVWILVLVRAAIKLFEQCRLFHVHIVDLIYYYYLLLLLMYLLVLLLLTYLQFIMFKKGQIHRPIYQCFLKRSFTELDKKNRFKKKSAFFIRKLICHSG